jgi:hypothetical protein
LGYTQKFDSKYLHSVRVYATGRNLHAFTKYKGGDPDAVPVNGLWPGAAGTLDVNHNLALDYYPSALQLLLGVQVQF